MKVYIAGPMTGLPDWNFPAFAEAAKLLSGEGHDVVNPAALHDHTDQPWLFYMKSALKAMLDCDSVYALHGCSMSKGASIELQLARSLGMPVRYQPADLNRYPNPKGLPNGAKAAD